MPSVIAGDFNVMLDGYKEGSPFRSASQTYFEQKLRGYALALLSKSRRGPSGSEKLTGPVQTRPIPVDEQHNFLDKAKSNDLKAVRKLLGATPGLVNVQPGGRWSALHQFARAGDAEAVKVLLELGADCNAKA